MKIPQMSTCCCGINLRTGTLILLWLTVVGCSLKALNSFGTTNERSKNKYEVSSPAANFFGYLLFGVLPSAVALYGVYKKKPSYMIPDLLISAFYLVLIVISMVLILLISLFASHLLKEYAQDYIPSGSPDQPSKEQVEIASGVLIIAGIFTTLLLGVVFAISAYYTNVIYSYYRHLKDEVKTNNVGYMQTAQSVNKVEEGQIGYYPPPYGQQAAA